MICNFCLDTGKKLYRKLGPAYMLWLTVILCAALPRLYYYLNCKDLWLDESFVAHGLFIAQWSNFLSGVFYQHQSFPIGFGLINKTLALFTSYTPHVLYVLPTLLGLLCVYLSLKSASALTGSKTAAFVCGILHTLLFSPLYYSSELKPYIYDVALMLLMYSVVLQDLASPERAERLISAKYPVLMLLVQLFSFPALSVCAAIGLLQIWYALKCRHSGMLPKTKLWVLTGTYVALGSLALVYFWFYIRGSAVAMNDSHYWDDLFLPLNPDRWPDYWHTLLVPWYRGLLETFSPALTSILVCLTLCGIPLGALWCMRHHRPALLLLILPLIGAVAVSALQVYPLGLPGFQGARLSLYLIPPLLLLTACGLLKISELSAEVLHLSCKLCSRLKLRLPTGGLLKATANSRTMMRTALCGTTAMLMLGLALLVNLRYISGRYVYQEQSYALFDYVYEHYRPSTDQLYLYGPAVFALRYYFDFKRLTYFPPFVEMDRNYLWLSNPHLEQVLRPDFMQCTGEVYFLLSHYWGGADLTILNYLDAHDIPHREIRTQGGLLIIAWHRR